MISLLDIHSVHLAFNFEACITFFENHLSCNFPPIFSTLFIFIFFLFLLTVSATQLVLKAHKEAVNSLSGTGSAKLGTVAAVVAAANSTALECSKEIEAAMQISLRNALGVMTNKTGDGPMDDFSIMKVW